jgi:Ca-activated chloride channel homolog
MTRFTSPKQLPLLGALQRRQTENESSSAGRGWLQRNRVGSALFVVFSSGCNAVHFGNPYALLLLVLGPAAIFLYRWRRPLGINFSAGSILAKTGRGWVGRLHWLPSALRVLAILGLVLAAARPQVRAPELAAKEGIDIVVTLDLSGSMSRTLKGRRPYVNDPSRLEVAKQVLLEQLLAKRPNDRIGIVIFGEEAYSRAPLTLDHELLARMIKDLSTDLFDQEFSSSTAIGDAIGVSTNRLRRGASRTKAIIILTDGASNSGIVTPEDAAASAAKIGARIYPILIGQEGGEGVDAGQLDRLSEATGTSQEIASAQGNDLHHFAAQNRQLLEKSIHGVLDSLDRAVIQSAGKESFQEVGPWVAAIAALLLALELLLRLWRFRGLP